MRQARFHLSIDEFGSCHGFSSEGAAPLHARSPSHCVVEIRMPLPAGSAPAPVDVSVRAAAATIADATAWLALDDGGACIAFASTEPGLAEVRETAGRCAEDTGLEIALVRVDVPHPAGSAPARITLT